MKSYLIGQQRVWAKPRPATSKAKPSSAASSIQKLVVDEFSRKFPRSIQIDQEQLQKETRDLRRKAVKLQSQKRRLEDQLFEFQQITGSESSFKRVVQLKSRQLQRLRDENKYLKQLIKSARINQRSEELMAAEELLSLKIKAVAEINEQPFDGHEEQIEQLQEKLQQQAQTQGQLDKEVSEIEEQCKVLQRLARSSQAKLAQSQRKHRQQTQALEKKVKLKQSQLQSYLELVPRLSADVERLQKRKLHFARSARPENGPEPEPVEPKRIPLKLKKHELKFRQFQAAAGSAAYVLTKKLADIGQLLKLRMVAFRYSLPQLEESIRNTFRKQAAREDLLRLLEGQPFQLANNDDYKERVALHLQRSSKAKIIPTETLITALRQLLWGVRIKDTYEEDLRRAATHISKCRAELEAKLAAESARPGVASGKVLAEKLAESGLDQEAVEAAMAELSVKVSSFSEMPWGELFVQPLSFQ